MKAQALLLAIAFTTSATEVQAQSRGAFERAYTRGDWERAAAVGERWFEREPGNSTAAYNTACAQALAGNPEAALEWLRLAGETGFAGTRSIDEDPDLESARALADFEDAVAAIRDNRARHFEAFQAEAERSEILTILPPDAPPGPRPLIVVLHGYGDWPAPNAQAYRGVARELGAIIAAPSALRPGPNGQGFSWTFRDEAEWWVLRAIDRVAERHAVDPERIVLAGFSQGANVALAVGLKHPRLFAGLLPVAGHYEQHLMPAPGTEGAPRVYLLIGKDDPFAATFTEAESNLREGGVEVRLRVIPGLGHGFPGRATSELREALEFLLPKQSGASDRPSE